MPELPEIQMPELPEIRMPDMPDAVKGLSLPKLPALPSLPEGSGGDGFMSGFKSLQGSLESQIEDAKSAVQGSIDNQVSGALGAVKGPLSGLKDSALEKIGISPEEVIVQTEQIGGAVSSLEAVLTPRATFYLDNAIVLPFWAGMLAFPDNGITKAIMKSYIPILLVGLIYGWSVYESFHDPQSLAAFSNILDFDALAAGFSARASASTVWAHILAQDLFVGRWIYLDGQRNSIFARHSLALCFLFGPLGIVSHLATRTLLGAFNPQVKDIFERGFDDGRPLPQERKKEPTPAPTIPSPKVVSSPVSNSNVSDRAEANTRVNPTPGPVPTLNDVEEVTEKPVNGADDA
ncbi:unnamed protein product [Chrysoparadoxa australica]